MPRSLTPPATGFCAKLGDQTFCYIGKKAHEEARRRAGHLSATNGSADVAIEKIVRGKHHLIERVKRYPQTVEGQAAARRDGKDD